MITMANSSRTIKKIKFYKNKKTVRMLIFKMMILNKKSHLRKKMNPKNMSNQKITIKINSLRKNRRKFNSKNKYCLKNNSHQNSLRKKNRKI